MDRVKRYYPIFLDLEDKRCLVVGGGPVGLEKTCGLLAAGANVDVIAEHFTGSFEELSEDKGKLHLINGSFSDGKVTDYYLVIAATGNPDTDYLIYKECHEAGILVNAADYIPGCDFILPARFQAGELQIAVSTGGASPALATWVRDSIGTFLGHETEILTKMLKEARLVMKERKKMPNKTLWRELLDSGLLEDIKAGNTDLAKQKIEQFIKKHS